MDVNLLYWGLFIANAVVMTVYFLLGFIAIKKERVSIYESFTCYIILSMIAKILFTVISAYI